MKFIKLFSLFFLIVFSTLPVAQQMDSSPNTYHKPRYAMTEAMWDVQLNFDVTAASGGFGNAGSEFDGTYIYSTRWASNLFHRYTTSGVLVEQFSIPGVPGLCDLAFDGEYMYGGTGTGTIYKMDFNLKWLVGTISSPVAVRHIAYDSINNGFWVGDWGTNIVLVSRTGVTLATISSATHGLSGIYGSAWDNYTPGGPFLWVFDHGAGAGSSQMIHQLQLPSGTPTGIIHDVMTDIGAGNYGVAGGLWIANNFLTGFFSLGGLLQGNPDEIFVYELGTTGPPCPVGFATNPSPPDGAINIPRNLTQLTWTNPTGGSAALSNEVFFGISPGGLNMIHSGSLVSSVNLPQPLEYNTTYYWKVVGKNDSCFSDSPLWKFKTINFTPLICDDFSIFNWTPIGPQGMTNWSRVSTNNAGGTPGGELRFSWIPSFVGESRLISPLTYVYPGVAINLHFRHYIDWYADPGGVFKVGYTKDGGINITNLWTLSNPSGNIGPELVSVYYLSPADTFQLVISFQGDSFNIDYWYIDDLCNYTWWPVELTSFTAIPLDNDVMISWSTATETNNKGFELERKTKTTDLWETIIFIDGSGTTTDPQKYFYTDKHLSYEKYYYRLKQIDYGGSSTYSVEIEASPGLPIKFGLSQNYPNPFNPSTIVEYSVASVSFVTLKVYDVLGNEIASLVNEEKQPGIYTTDFNGEGLSSGIYFYRLTAGDETDIKKMMMMK